MSGADALQEAALAYAARGWPVFPCQPHDKRPAGALVPHGLKEASTDPEVIRRWWAAEPAANVALVTGVHFDVLDLDGEQGITSALDLAGQYGALPAGPSVWTPSDGLHLYFAPTGAGNRAGLRPGIDWRGNGGYVLAPPSVHPNGGTYSWLTTPEAGVEAPLRDDPEPDPGGGALFLPAPEWLVDLVRGPRRRQLDVPRGEQLLRDSARQHAYGRRALESECGKVALARVGTRNDTLHRAAFSLGTLVGAGALAATEAGDALLAVALRAGLSEHEAEATIRSGMSAGIAHPRRVA